MGNAPSGNEQGHNYRNQWECRRLTSRDFYRPTNNMRKCECGEQMLSDTCRENQRNVTRKRGQHCFVYRTPPVGKLRPPSRQRRHQSSRMECSNSNISCCCPPPEPKAQHRNRDKLCCMPRHQLPPQVDQPNYYPPPPPGQTAPFAPAVQAINEAIDEPQDPYYNYDQHQQNSSNPGINPLANFDLNRFDRDHIGQAGGPGRRRNVSIRTCVDYDYDPGHRPVPPSHPCPQRPPARFSPRLPSPCPCFQSTKRNIRDSQHSEDYSTGYRFVPCPHRR